MQLTKSSSLKGFPLPFPSLKNPNVPSMPAVRFPMAKRQRNVGSAVSAWREAKSGPISEVVFEPFEEVKTELIRVPTVPDVSLARQKYSDQCEAAINEQINVEYSVSYVYHAMFAYFDRDNVAFKGFAKFFKESSLEEREHAQKLMEYQNKRGGKVQLQTMLLPLSEFNHVEKGDAPYAMELALSLEKLNNDKLRDLIASGANDVHLADFLESEFLTEQVELIKKLSDYVAQLRRLGTGHGVWHFDKMLSNAPAAA